MMRRLIAAAAALLSLCWLAVPAYAQPEYAQAVSACGTPNNSPKTGGVYPITQDLLGNLCTATSGGTQIVAGAASNASSGVATTSTNVPNVSYNYGWNGTTWDQLKTLPAVPTTGVGILSAGLSSIYNTTPPTLTNGQYGAVQMDSDGSLKSEIVTRAGSSATGILGVGMAAQLGGGGQQIPLGSAPYIYNGTSRDAQVSIAGAVAVGSVGTGTTAVEHAGYKFNEITTATTTAVQSGASILHRVSVNTCVTSATIKVYNALTATGTPITITCPVTVTDPFFIDYDAYFSTGITVVTSGLTDVTVGYR